MKEVKVAHRCRFALLHILCCISYIAAANGAPVSGISTSGKRAVIGKGIGSVTHLVEYAAF
jgi:hypothetical protein